LTGTTLIGFQLGDWPSCRGDGAGCASRRAGLSLPGSPKQPDLNHREDTGLNIPIIDISALIHATDDRGEVAAQIGQAGRECGFFYIVGHGVDEQLQQGLETVSRAFFAQATETKLEIRMSRGARAWRGYFPVGGELTSGKPDLKEGIYFGTELDSNHPLVQSNTPMHGANLFPATIPHFRETVLDYIAAMTRLGHALMAGIALSLELEASYFADRYTADPLILFRIFNYPPAASMPDAAWGVGEHTDYGLLTILKQDMSGGLQVKIKSRWVDAPPIPNSFVCNIGDMLDRMTGGLYLSTPHRAQNVTAHHRLAFPFFFDPNFNAEVQPIQSGVVNDNQDERWDHTSVHEFHGTYGDYLLGKVSKVFPALRREAL
jgi:isopenicillin N synthase-like dioxygenase